MSPTRFALATALVIPAVAVSCADRSGSQVATPGCSEYLDCLAEIDSAMFEAELPTYGTQGSCFSNSDAETCHGVCRQRLEEVNSTAEVCNPPEPEPESDHGPGNNPPPDASGYVDCALIEGGPTVGPGEPGPTGFPVTPCNPRASGEGSHKCCSDDPAAEGGALPAYANKDISGGATPYFAGANNAQSTSGLCVRTEDIPVGGGLLEPAAANCPIPCNPTWSADEITIVCGNNRVCCQTRELQAADCVQAEGESGFRPVTGADIPDLTDWSPA
ncbi:MAG: hypothetical protein AAF721_22820, partial [Myxococcota bacterium]